MKLISMTDFVLEQDTNQTSARRLSQIIGYAEFLKKPLKLEMFVPCDDNGTVLKHPIYTTNHSDECYCKGCEEETKRCSDLQDQYRKAKEKVLFEGFSVLSDDGYIIELECKDIYINYNKEEDLFFLDSWNGDALIMDIECLANLINHTSNNIILTENAIKLLTGNNNGITNK